MSKKIIKESKEVYICDMCSKEADEDYSNVEGRGDYCEEHGRAVEGIADKLSRINKDRTNILIQDFLFEQEKAYEEAIITFIKSLKDKVFVEGADAE